MPWAQVQQWIGVETDFTGRVTVLQRCKPSTKAKAVSTLRKALRDDWLEPA